MMEKNLFPFCSKFSVNENLFLRVSMVDSRLYSVRRVLSFFFLAFYCVTSQQWFAFVGAPSLKHIFNFPSNTFFSITESLMSKPPFSCLYT